MEAKFTGDEIVLGFVEQMMRDKGVEDKEEKQRLIEEIDKEIDLRIVKNLPDDRLRALDEELGKDSPSQDKINALVLGAGVDFRKITETVFSEFRKKYMEGR